MTDPVIRHSLIGGDNNRCTFRHLRQFVAQAQALGYSQSAYVYLEHNCVRVGTAPHNLSTEPFQPADHESWLEDLDARLALVEDATRTETNRILHADQERMDAATEPTASEPQPDAAVLTDTNEALSSERDAALAEVQQLTKLLDDLTRTGNALERAKNKAETEAEKARKTAIDNGHRINVLTTELAEAKANAKEPREIVVGEAEQVQAIQRLLLAIGAHRASSHGGRMSDAGDQILWDVGDEIAKQFSPDTREAAT